MLLSSCSLLTTLLGSATKSGGLHATNQMGQNNTTRQTTGISNETTNNIKSSGTGAKIASGDMAAASRNGGAVGRRAQQINGYGKTSIYNSEPWYVSLAKSYGWALLLAIWSYFLISWAGENLQSKNEKALVRKLMLKENGL